MPGLPSQIDFQQENARRVAAGDLEVMGKRASAAWSGGEFRTLGEAVVETVKHAGLSPEQVRRVVEFANTDAFLEAFHKLGSGHRYVDFGHGILADPREVIRDLNDGGGGSVFDRGTADYDAPPPADKTASANPLADEVLMAAFTKEAEDAAPEPQWENPAGWVWELRDKLAGANQHLTSMLGGLEVAYADVAGNLYEQVKQAARGGASLGQVVRAWSTVTDDPTYVKVAFQFVAPRLLRESVFQDPQQLQSSIEKTGSARLVNPEHPLVTGFGDYCEVLCKLAEVRQERDRMADKLAKVNYAIKRYGGNLDKLAGAVGQAFDLAGKAGRKLTGGSGGEVLGKAALLGGTALGAKGLYNLASSNPTVMQANMYLNPHSQVHKDYIRARRGQVYQDLMGWT